MTTKQTPAQRSGKRTIFFVGMFFASTASIAFVKALDYIGALLGVVPGNADPVTMIALLSVAVVLSGFGVYLAWREMWR